MDMNPQLQDRELLEVLLNFALNNTDAEIERFKPGLRDCGSLWIETPAEQLAAAELLADSLNHCTDSARQLLQTFNNQNHRLRWEQSYRKQDELVPNAMLAAYGFVEIIGLQGRAAELKRELGIIDQWKTVGPFFARRADAGSCVFEPEHHVDFERSIVTLRATRDDNTTLEWRDPIPGRDVKERPDVLILPIGWVRFDYKPYGQRNAAIYALTNVTVAEDTDALAHVRADDDFTLFVSGERMVDYSGRGSNGASRNDWRGPRPPLPDGMRVPIRLRAGRNRVLVKIENGGGTAGVSLALSRPDGARANPARVDTK